MAKSVFCIARTKEQATRIVGDLSAEGFLLSDMSVVSHRGAARGSARAQRDPEPTAAPGGWLAGTGSVAVPGFGPSAAPGPISAAPGPIRGASSGGPVGGLAGALVDCGMPEYQARRYAEKIRSGDVLISLQTEARTERERVREIFERAGADEIATESEGEATHPAA